jgi:hypothetical protein
MKFPTQLAILVISLAIQAQQINDINNIANSALTNLNINLPTDQVKSILTLVEDQVNPSQPTESPTTITGINSNTEHTHDHNSASDSTTPTDNSDNNSATPTDSPSNKGNRSNTSSPATTSNTSSDTQISSSAKYSQVSSGILFALIGSYLL